MKNNLIFILLIIPFYTFSQPDIIDVSTTGQGKSKDEATKNALRSALEESFGAFISSKTEIVNDEIINDEIISISTGNIVSYEVLSNLIDDNIHYVSVDSKVSLVKFSNYIQSKGYDVSFNGKSFGMKLKLQEFNRTSEYKSLTNILEIFKLKLKKSIEFKLELKNDPILLNKEINPNDSPPYKFKIGSEDKRRQFNLPVFRSSGNLHKISENFNKKTGGYNRFLLGKNEGKEIYGLRIEIVWGLNQNFLESYTYLINSLKSISMKEVELVDYKKQNRDFYTFTTSFPSNQEHYEDILKIYDIKNSHSERYVSAINYLEKKSDHESDENILEINLRSKQSVNDLLNALSEIQSYLYNFKLDFGIDVFEPNRYIVPYNQVFFDNLPLSSYGKKRFMKLTNLDYISQFYPGESYRRLTRYKDPWGEEIDYKNLNKNSWSFHSSYSLTNYYEEDFFSLFNLSPIGLPTLNKNENFRCRKCFKSMYDHRHVGNIENVGSNFYSDEYTNSPYGSIIREMVVTEQSGVRLDLIPVFFIEIDGTRGYTAGNYLNNYYLKLTDTEKTDFISNDLFDDHNAFHHSFILYIDKEDLSKIEDFNIINLN